MFAIDIGKDFAAQDGSSAVSDAEGGNSKTITNNHAQSRIVLDGLVGSVSLTSPVPAYLTRCSPLEVLTNDISISSNKRCYETRPHCTRS
jgi:hypothetical protein